MMNPTEDSASALGVLENLLGDLFGSEIRSGRIGDFQRPALETAAGHTVNDLGRLYALELPLVTVCGSSLMAISDTQPGCYRKLRWTT